MKRGTIYIFVKRATALVTALAFSLTAIAVSPQHAHTDPGWGTDWTYRMAIEVSDSSGSVLSDFQVPITIDTATFDYSKAGSNGNDIRFGTAGGIDCDYWIEAWNASGESTIWVKLPAIPADGTTTIYMYYGNAAAAPASNGTKTFIFFDDFSSDLSKWNKHVNGASINIVAGYLECGGGSTTSPYGHTVIGSDASYANFSDGIIEGKLYLAVDAIAEVGYRGDYGTNTGYKSRMDARSGQGLAHLSPPYSSWDFIPSGGGPTGTAVAAGAWHDFSITASASALSISCAGQTLGGTDSSYSGAGEISLQNHYGSYSRFDDIRVRKYAPIEPTVNLGLEETTTSDTDYFGGTAAVSASGNVTVIDGEVVLSRIATDSAAFSDSFESDLGKWDGNGATSWYLASDRCHDGSRSVKADRNNNGYLTSDDIDLSDATATTIDFWFNKDDTESGDFNLYFYDGADWILISQLDTLGSDDEWLHYNNVSIDLAAYGISNFRIRFDATLGWLENVWLDQLTVTKTTEQYCDQGSITSVSISPGDLQSWGRFTASDSTQLCLPYRKAINIAGTGTLLTDYQTHITVSHVTGKMNADFSDLRFKDGSGDELSYWIESYVSEASAEVWIKVPSIPADGTTTIYMYYGNAAAAPASNGTGTFIFFDDFSSDLSKWNKHVNGANINIVAGYLECGGGSTTSPYGHTVIGSDASYANFSDAIIEGKVYLAVDAIAEVGYRGDYGANTGYKSRMDARSGQGLAQLSPPYSAWNLIPSGGGPTGTALAAGAWHDFSITANASALGISCAGQTLSGTDSSYSGAGEISLQNHYGSYSRFDDIRVRKYAPSEPTSGFGGEESGNYCGFNGSTPAVSVTYKILRAADDAVLCTINAAQAAAGYDISSCTGTASGIKLLAEAATVDPSLAPVLYEWRVTWAVVPAATIDVTAPGDIASWLLDPGIGENSINGTLSINVSPNDASWSLTARDLDMTTNGSMTQWDGFSYGAMRLVDPMRIHGPAAEVTLPNAAEVCIAAGTGDYPNVSITFKQNVSWEDEPGTYRIVVTFIATVN